MRGACLPAVALAAVGLALAGCTGPSGPPPAVSAAPTLSPARVSAALPGRDVGPVAPFVSARPGDVVVHPGRRLVAPGVGASGGQLGLLQRERESPDQIHVRSVDLSWAQIQPDESGPIDRSSTGWRRGCPSSPSATSSPSRDRSGCASSPAVRTGHRRGSSTDASSARTAPTTTASGTCRSGTTASGTRSVATYRALFADAELGANPNLRFVYVPGAFTWAEYDYETINAAVKAGDLDLDAYLAWYAHAWSDLATIFGADANKLVFTGEDYPWSVRGGRRPARPAGGQCGPRHPHGHHRGVQLPPERGPRLRLAHPAGRAHGGRRVAAGA